MSISVSGTLAGIGARSCGGVPKTVARSAAESARPVAGPVVAGSAAAGVVPWADAAGVTDNANNATMRLKRDTPHGGIRATAWQRSRFPVVAPWRSRASVLVH
jgi:hypothetical protein